MYSMLDACHSLDICIKKIKNKIKNNKSICQNGLCTDYHDLYCVLNGNPSVQ